MCHPASQRSMVESRSGCLVVYSSLWCSHPFHIDLQLVTVTLHSFMMYQFILNRLILSSQVEYRHHKINNSFWAEGAFAAMYLNLSVINQVSLYSYPLSMPWVRFSHSINVYKSKINLHTKPIKGKDLGQPFVGSFHTYYHNMNLCVSKCQYVALFFCLWSVKTHPKSKKEK